MQVELVVRMGSFVGDGLGNIRGGDRCIVGDGFFIYLDGGKRPCEKV